MVVRISICVGCGLDINPTSGLLEVQLAPGGGLTCDANGLHATATSFPGISPNACNAITNPNGLYAPRTCTIANASLRGYLGATFPVPMTAVASYAIQNDGGDISIKNNTDCEMIGLWDVQAYGGGVTMAAGADANAFLETSTDGAAYGIATPETYFRMDNRSSGGATDYNINNLWERNYVHFNPGETHTLGAKVRINITTGSATWYDSGVHGLAFPRFEFHWHFTTTGSC